MYKIFDPQCGRYLGDGEIFTSLEDCREKLASYHSIDWTADADINSLTLDELVDYGEWTIELLPTRNITPECICDGCE